MSHWKNYADANWGKSEGKKSSKGGVREDNCKGFKEGRGKRKWKWSSEDSEKNEISFS